MEQRIAIYPGTFDPFTNGHLDIVKRSSSLFDKVIIAVSDHGRKETLFNIKNRVEAIKKVMEELPNVEVASFDKLLTTFAEQQNAVAIIRGLRVTSDFEYEFKMAQFIREQNAEIEVIYLMATNITLHISSSSVKELASLGADVSKYLPPSIVPMLAKAYS